MSYHSFDGHGVDVAQQRADALDKLALVYVTDNPGCRVLDLGCGIGGQSLRMAEAGAMVTAIDQYNFSDQFADYDNENLEFVSGDITQATQLLPDRMFAIGLCQRTIHYLPYQAALETLRSVRAIVRSHLYISVTGTRSLVGDTYPAAVTPLPDRFAELSDLGKDMFSIAEPVCLYSETEFKLLLEDAGWQIDSCRVTAFGNIQAVCSNTMS